MSDQCVMLNHGEKLILVTQEKWEIKNLMCMCESCQLESRNLLEKIWFCCRLQSGDAQKGLWKQREEEPHSL